VAWIIYQGRRRQADYVSPRRANRQLPTAYWLQNLHDLFQPYFSKAGRSCLLSGINFHPYIAADNKRKKFDTCSLKKKFAPAILIVVPPVILENCSASKDEL
jgi:hypothetical protein